MRICSCNVNGLRAFNSKGALSELYNMIKPDVLCLQEIKCNHDIAFDISNELSNEIDLRNWSIMTCCNSNAGYAGVATISNEKFDEMELPDEFCDAVNSNDYYGGRVVIIPLKMNCENPKDRIILINVYTLNSGYKDELRVRWDKLFFDLIKLLRLSFNVIICGDLNVVKDENDHWAGLSNKVDCGPGLMKYEHDGITRLTNVLGLSDAYKLCHPEGSKKSWFSYRNAAYAHNHGWRIDYFLVDDRIRDLVVDSDIYEDVLGSDHRPITLDINI